MCNPFANVTPAQFNEAMLIVETLEELDAKCAAQLASLKTQPIDWSDIDQPDGIPF